MFFAFVDNIEIELIKSPNVCAYQLRSQIHFWKKNIPMYVTDLKNVVNSEIMA